MCIAYLLEHAQLLPVMVHTRQSWESQLICILDVYTHMLGFSYSFFGFVFTFRVLKRFFKKRIYACIVCVCVCVCVYMKLGAHFCFFFCSDMKIFSDYECVTHHRGQLDCCTPA